MILYYLIAGVFALLTALTTWSYAVISRIVSDSGDSFERITNRLKRHSESILELKEDLLIQKDTIRILKKNLFSCLQGAHLSPGNTPVDNNHQRRRGRPKKHS